MTKQYIWALAIVGAFVAGTILTSTLYDNTAFAIHQPNHNPPGNDNDMGWKSAVTDLQAQIDTLNVDDADNDPSNELQELSSYVIDGQTFSMDGLETRGVNFPFCPSGVPISYSIVTTNNGILLTDISFESASFFAVFHNTSNEAGEVVLAIRCAELTS